MRGRVLVVAHDAGGAEMLAAWCAEHAGEYDARFCLEGPAQVVFERTLGAVENGNLEAVRELSDADFVLTGSSLEADLERRAIARARQQGVKVCTFLDHWDLYRQRFELEGGEFAVLPDEIWVGDTESEDLAVREGFPVEKICNVGNPYIEKQVAAVYRSESRTVRHGLLYLCEPISRKLAATFGDSAISYDDELVIVGNLLDALSYCAAEVPIVLRPHPSESAAKYLSLIDAYAERSNVSVSQGTTLAADIAAHDVVVGVESMALVVALAAGRHVYSCITGKPWTISLPHQGIHHVTSFEQILELEFPSLQQVGGDKP